MAWHRRAGRKLLRLLDAQTIQWVEGKRYARQANRASSDWKWYTAPPCPTRRLDAVSVQHDGRLYVFGGYERASDVLSVCDVFDMRTRQWAGRFPLADGMGRSHLAIVADDGGHVYAASGQPGPHCGPATDRCFSLDLATRTWQPLPSLPEPRYAATMQHWRGRLHLVGGSKPDRTTPAVEHWSLAVDRGKALEDQWTEEVPIPTGGCHRASVVIDHDLFVFGGQQGDFVAVPGDPRCTCTGDLTEELYCAEVFRLSARDHNWERRSEMPIASSHIESAFLQRGSKVLFFGGQIYKDRDTRRLELTDAIQMYDADTDVWQIVGTLPNRVKNLVVGHRDDGVYVSAGQRDVGPHDASPGRYTDATWHARLPRALR